MANTIKDIEMGKITPNPLNNRSMNLDEIEIIKESILEVGLLHPLAVYEDSEDHFVLISGHKRFKALQEIGKLPTSTVQCMVVAKPTDTVNEQELLARANVHRSNPEQVAQEVEIVSNIWNTMNDSKRKKLTEVYRQAFVEANKDNPLFTRNPQEFITNRFRPRAEYINHITGLGLSNKTIQLYLKSTLKRENEELIEEEKPAKVKTFTIKQIVKAIQSLDGLIDGYSSDHGDVPDVLVDLQSDLRNACEAISN